MYSFVYFSRKMATSSSTWAQDVITCDLCVNPTQRFCNSCHASLCGACINKHIEDSQSLSHDIVSFKDRTARLVFSLCESHPTLRCEGHCQQCGVSVCFSCVNGPHAGHNVIDGYTNIAEVVRQKKEKIKRDTQELESIFSPRFLKGIADVEPMITKTAKKYGELEKESEHLRTTWHQEVDQIFDAIHSSISSMKEDDLTTLKRHQYRLQGLEQEVKSIINKNKEILKSNKVDEVASYKSKLDDYRNIATHIDVTIPELKTNIVLEREHRVELGEYKARLTRTSLTSLAVTDLLDRVRVIATIPTEHGSPLGVACVGTDEAWIINPDNTIRLFDIRGSFLGAEKTFTGWLSGMTVTRRGDLLFSDGDDRTVNIVRYDNTEILITAPIGWHPASLCCTRADDILVCMCDTNQRNFKLVQYQEQTVKQEIYKDKGGNPIFRGLLYLAENNNGDICVSDTGASAVLVADRTGSIRFRYDGSPAKKRAPFLPRQIVTDSISQIIVTDENNDCLHILDQNGQFLKCVEDCGLDKPIGLGLDDGGKLWVTLRGSNVLKVIEYMK